MSGSSAVPPEADKSSPEAGIPHVLFFDQEGQPRDYFEALDKLEDLKEEDLKADFPKKRNRKTIRQAIKYKDDRINIIHGSVYRLVVGWSISCTLKYPQTLEGLKTGLGSATMKRDQRARYFAALEYIQDMPIDELFEQFPNYEERRNVTVAAFNRNIHDNFFHHAEAIEYVLRWWKRDTRKEIEERKQQKKKEKQEKKKLMTAGKLPPEELSSSDESESDSAESREGGEANP
ncbi:hypothetical protein EJ04DRAFT_590811 [Polyplosphaeria fusca]|uniref:Uncharacterized protein n=1 Tax=Polyplosphaeria fusca TaxID=682080 RepID=A0A9P4QLV7_9PLEO|nr:hypothetical protein EJ04DRAFT_590811 [Polyplosphaeria fusca]